MTPRVRKAPTAFLFLLLTASGRPASQQPSCRMEVVHCNYGALYSGTMSWIKTIDVNVRSTNSTRVERRTDTVAVTVTNGRGVCAGSVVENRNTMGDEVTRGKLRATITGSALFAVEFDYDDARRLYYLVTAACASEAGTDSTLNVKTGVWGGDDITPTPPALDGREMQSDKQPATTIGMKLLQGNITFPNADADPANGVTGSVTVRWDLKRP